MSRSFDMKRFCVPIITLLVVFGFTPFCLAQESIQHSLSIKLNPSKSFIEVKDTITVPETILPDLRFRLHKGLAPSSPTSGVKIIYEGEKPGFIPIETFKVILPSTQNTFVLDYSGIIHHPLESYGKEYARGFRNTAGTISEQGIYLSGNSFWYPHFDIEWINFSMQIELPAMWNAVSQGERSFHEQEENNSTTHWDSPEPQDEIFIIAAPFKEYSQTAGRIQAMVFLRSPDEKLANKYLEATNQYVSMYEKLLGPYPYKKFALVENFWETGFGMPSFTLLGPKVIRFPFILHSSFPHEILHNWWGNSVFLDYQKGNWSEGLTAYLADHLIKEQRGSGMEYRQGVLQKYTDYAANERDFPLTKFTSRHSSATEAVGYGKSLMFFHMLRRNLSDNVFTRGLQDFYQNNKFRFASFADLQKSFEKISGKDLKTEFNQWITKTGAPKLQIKNATVTKEKNEYVLKAFLEQTQAGDAYQLKVPFAVTMEGQSNAHQGFVVMDKKRHTLAARLPARPLRLDIDPEFDLFRKLDREEIPPALSQAFGSKKMLILLPSSSNKAFSQGYRDLAKAWSQSGPDEVEVKLDSEIKNLPADMAITLFGWDNRLLDQLKTALSKYDVNITKKNIKIGNSVISRKNHSIVLTARHPQNMDISFTWVATDVPEAIPGLGRKLPHYHKYSYLAFEGKEPANIAKGRWPVLNSPMTLFIPREDNTMPKTDMGKLAPRSPLINLPPVFSKEKMMETIHFLASDNLKGRGFGTKELDEAANYIAKKFQEAGLKPAGDSATSFFQTWEAAGGEPRRKAILKNIVGFIPGQNPAMADQSVVIGAHYDHLGLGWPDVRKEHKGKIHNGADDNASGVAVLVELARVLSKNFKPDRNIVFVAFTGEEAGKIGSKHYVENQKRFPAEQCIGMVNLDTVGRLGKKKLLILGAGSAREWVHIFRGAGFVTGVEIETVSEELDSSDQKSFQEEGVPAVQLFSGPHLDYHSPTDTEDKIDPDGLVKIASVTKETIEYLANRKEPMASTLKKGSKEITPTQKKARKVSLGTIPDFAYQGEGYRLSGVVPESPAEAAGLKEGDIIVHIGTQLIHGLRDVSKILKTLSPGTRIAVTFLRNEKKNMVEIEVTAR